MDVYGIGNLCLLSCLDENNLEMKRYIEYTANRHFENGYDGYCIMIEENTGRLYFLHTTLVSYGGACFDKPEHIEEVRLHVVKSLLMCELNRYRSLLEKYEDKKDMQNTAFYQRKIRNIESFLNKSLRD